MEKLYNGFNESIGDLDEYMQYDELVSFLEKSLKDLKKTKEALRKNNDNNESNFIIYDNKCNNITKEVLEYFNHEVEERPLIKALWVKNNDALQSAKELCSPMFQGFVYPSEISLNEDCLFIYNKYSDTNKWFAFNKNYTDFYKYFEGIYKECKEIYDYYVNNCNMIDYIYRDK